MISNAAHSFPAALFSILVLGCCSPGVDRKINTSPDVPQITLEPEVRHDEWKDCGGQLENHACNFEFNDQYGDGWELYDHYGDIIVLDFSAVWCGVCQYVAKDMQSFYDEYQDKGVTWVTVLLQDLQGMPVSTEEALEWSQIFGIVTSPVLAGDVSIADPNEEGSFPVQALPTIIILDRDMVVSHVMNGWNESRVRNYLSGMLDAEKEASPDH